MRLVWFFPYNPYGRNFEPMTMKMIMRMKMVMILDTFSVFAKLIKNSCFATSQTKYCFFYSSSPVFFSFFFAFGPLFGFVFCNKSNGILRFYDFSKKYHFSWKCLLLDANFSFFTFCFKTCIILHIFSQF